jgi:hypothetical protein
MPTTFEYETEPDPSRGGIATDEPRKPRSRSSADRSSPRARALEPGLS